MKRYNKIILITAGIITVAGMAITAAALTLGAGTENRDIEYKSETITDKITAVDIDVDYNDIMIVPRDTNEITLHYAEGGTRQYDIHAENNMLAIKCTREKNKKLKWYDYINLNFIGTGEREHQIIIEVPRGFSADVKINDDLGDIKISGIKGSLDAFLNCGDIEIDGCEFTSLECQADLGDIEIRNTKAQTIKTDNNCGDTEFVEVTGNITAECDLGDIEFENIVGDKLVFENHCGDIEGTILGKKEDYEAGGSKQLEANTNMGDVEIIFVG